MSLMPLCIGLFAFSASALPPPHLERESYKEWLEAIGSNVSPFHEHSFDWLEKEEGSPLPGESYSDPKGMHLVVNNALAQTIELEEMGEIEKGITYGFEAYIRVPFGWQAVLESLLFRWGKPVGKSAGFTYPNDTVFGYRKESLTEKWGPGSYQTFTEKKNGGLAKDQNDSFTVLVRPYMTGGAVFVGNFFAPTGNTTTKSSLFIMVIKPVDDSTTAVKIFSRHLGQSYALFGVDFGRKNFGFNVERFRNGQIDFLQNVEELVRTGGIREREPGGLSNPGWDWPVGR